MMMETAGFCEHLESTNQTWHRAQDCNLTCQPLLSCVPL